MYCIQMASLNNRLKQSRGYTGLSQQELASRAGISRQAYSALESGKAVPSTEVALRLARALATRVDALFFLAEEPPTVTQAELVGVSGNAEAPSSNGPQRVRLFRVGRRLLARPLAGPAAARDSLVDAEGVIVPASRDGQHVIVRPFDANELDGAAIGMLGCDPAVALLEPGLRRCGVKLVWTEESSYQALSGLARGEAHVAGCHLKDETTGLFNLSWVQRVVPFACTLVTFAAWHQGLIVAPRNPIGIRGIDDLTAPGVTIVNRPTGSGSRSLLDRLMREQGIPASALVGYDREVGGHMAVARAVAAGIADAGVGVQVAASALGLGFVLLEEERYDLVIPDHLLDEPGVQALLDLLQEPGLCQRVESLGGYDTSNMGTPAVGV